MGGVLGPAEPGLDEGEPGLHEDHEHRAEDHPQEVRLLGERVDIGDDLLGSGDAGERQQGRAGDAETDTRPW